nr:zinc knuckle CX2CX4HX4C [Tanacetum cinerariifolium]
ANRNNAYVIPCKVSHAYDSINLNVHESTIPNDPIIQSVDINTKSTSYVGAVGASAKDQPNVSNFRTLVADPVFDGVNVSVRKVVKKGKSSFARCLIKVNSDVDLMNVVTIGIPSLSGDCFTKENIRVEESVGSLVLEQPKHKSRSVSSYND